MKELGDPAVFEEIVSRYERPLLRFLYGIVQDHQLAQDLCQETLISIYRARPRLEENDNLAGLLYTIALNQARGAVRRQRLIRWIPFSAGLHDRPDERSDPSDQLDVREELRAALKRLPVDQRACLLLHAEGYHYAEIASMIGCSVGATKLRLFRARRALQALYRDRQENG